ncbi:MAG: hypothetical protein HWE23_01175 [Rhodobacteraceae bacterium]|nr:hypothetical protein [Paracoccaceae bacterium]
MSESTRFVCQTYRRAARGKGSSKRQVLVQGTAIECKTSTEAQSRAQRMFEGGSYAGVDAYSVVVDIDMGDYSDPIFFLRLGDVPPLDM